MTLGLSFWMANRLALIAVIVLFAVLVTWVSDWMWPVLP